MNLDSLNQLVGVFQKVTELRVPILGLRVDADDLHPLPEEGAGGCSCSMSSFTISHRNRRKYPLVPPEKLSSLSGLTDFDTRSSHASPLLIVD